MIRILRVVVAGASLGALMGGALGARLVWGDGFSTAASLFYGGGIGLLLGAVAGGVGGLVSGTAAGLIPPTRPRSMVRVALAASGSLLALLAALAVTYPRIDYTFLCLTLPLVAGSAWFVSSWCLSQHVPGQAASLT